METPQQIVLLTNLLIKLQMQIALPINLPMALRPIDQAAAPLQQRALQVEHQLPHRIDKVAAIVEVVVLGGVVDIAVVALQEVAVPHEVVVAHEVAVDEDRF
jgi:hypothetical protein